MNLSPLPIQKFFGNNGRPLDGGLLFTYAAGTSNKIATYTDSTGGASNTNPIVLDFRGECRLWIDPMLAYKFVLAPRGDTDPPGDPIWTVDNITAGPAQQDNAANDTGSVNNIALSIPQISSPVAFTRIVFRAAHTNTGPVTITINGGTSKALTWQNIGAFAGGEIQANGIYEAIYDGAQWQLQGPALQPPQMRTAAEISAGITPIDFTRPELDIRRYGAVGDDSTDCTTAIQDALDVARIGGGGTVTCGYGESYRITGKLRIGSGTTLNLTGSTIRQATNNTIILEVSGGGASFISSWGIRNGLLEYVTQQTGSDTSAIGVRLAVGGVTSFFGALEGVTVSKAYRGFDVPNIAGAFAFLTKFVNCAANNCKDWGFFIQGDTATGGCTNMSFDTCWVLQTSGAEQSGSKGYLFSGVSQLNIGCIACDHIEAHTIASFTNCDGFIGSITGESCEFSGSSDVVAQYLFDTCQLRIGELKATENTVDISGTADACLVRSAASALDIGVLKDNNTVVTDTSTGKYYTIVISGTGSRISVYDYISSGSTPAVDFADFSVPAQIENFDGVARNSVVTPAQIISNQNDYAPATLSGAVRTYLRLSSDASRSITGLAGGSAAYEAIIFNVGSFDIVLVNDTTSTPANRFVLGADVTINPGEGISLWYDGSSARWRSAGKNT